MKLSRLRDTWTRLGAEDPLWAVLSNPDTRGGRWDVDAFFASGRKDIAEVLRNIARLNVIVERRNALDFGCGVGRLTQALAKDFAQVTGVDIASSMLEKARELARAVPQCTFVLNTTADLAQFSDSSFDFVFSHIVFQHMEPRFALRYIAEFGRILRPGGAAVFQVLVPDGSHALTHWLKTTFPGLAALVRRFLKPGEPPIELYGIRQRDLLDVLRRSKLQVVESIDDPNGGRGTRGIMMYTRRIA